MLTALDFYADVPGAREQAVLSACQAWSWAVDGVWRSKGDSARWAMQRLADTRPVDRALRLRDGEPADLPGRDEVELVLATARAALAGTGGAPRDAAGVPEQVGTP